MYRTAIAGALTCAFLLLPAAAQAAPGSDTFVEAQEFTVPGKQTRSAIAVCPTGSRVVGGGVGTTGSTPDGNVTPYNITSSGPRDATGLPGNAADGAVADRWFAEVVSANGTQQFKTFALCSRTSDATLEVTQYPVEGKSARSAKADCPAGSRAVGGGTDPLASPTAGSTLLSGPLDETGSAADTGDGEVARSWTASIYHGSDTTTGQYKVLALCSRTSDATVEATQFNVGPKAAASATTSCPAGSRVLGGGITTTGPEPVMGSQYFLFLNGPFDESGKTLRTEDGDVARQWFAYAYNGLNAQNAFKVSALCAREEAPRPGPGGGGGNGGGGNGGGGGRAIRCAGKRATIVGTSRRDVLRGTRRRDVIAALGGKDRVVAGAGNDIVCGGSGNDKLSGGKGNDRLFGQGGRDVMSGQRGRDRCVGGAAKDRATCERKRGI